MPSDEMDVQQAATISTSIVPYEAEHVAAVARMNSRMHSGGSKWAFYGSNVPLWLPLEHPEQSVFRKYYVCVEPGGEVRGGFSIKQQVFLVRGEPVTINTWQGPISEVVVNPAFKQVGRQCMAHIVGVNPYSYNWGGSPRLHGRLASLNWVQVNTTMMMRLVDCEAVLRSAPFLQNSTRLAPIATFAAKSGLGTLGIRGVQAGRAALGVAFSPVEVAPVDDFGDWSDAIWELARASYGVTAIRDADTLRRLMGKEGWPGLQILRMSRRGACIGWATIRVNRMRDDARFGNLVVGSIVDALAIPGEETSVIRAATRALEQTDAQLVACNVMHARWRKAFSRSGFLALPKSRKLFMTQAMQAMLHEKGINIDSDMHFMSIDGDGPFGL